MPRRRQKLTAVERMIVLAILGILLSVIMPALQRQKRQALRARRPQPSYSQREREPAGQLNTIEVTEVEKRRRHERPMDMARVVGALVRLVAVVVAAVLVVVAVRRAKMKRAEQ